MRSTSILYSSCASCEAREWNRGWIVDIFLVYMKIIYIPLRFQVGQFELMNKTSLFRQVIDRLLFLFLLSIFLTGCAAEKRSRPPFTSAAEATAALKEYSSGLNPLKATGTCSMNYTDEEGKKNSQSFPVRIWFVNTRKFCLYGDVAFDPKGMSFALDGEDYWVYAKPFGVYSTGKINEGKENYFSSPAVFLDFLQPVSTDCDSSYMAAADKTCNILICRNSGKCRTKKIFIDRCEQLVKKIEYLNCSGNPALVVELDEYKETGGQASPVFPRKLTYKYFQGQKCIDTRQIKLDSVKLWLSNPAQLKALFTPPDVNSLKKEIK
jgi:hypothetical protein